MRGTASHAHALALGMMDARKLAKHPATQATGWGGGALALVLLFMEMGIFDRFTVSTKDMDHLDEKVSRVEESVNWLVAREWARAGEEGPPPPTPRNLPAVADSVRNP